MKIAAYCRVSTDKAEQLDSLEKQEAFFREFAAREGHKLVGVYADEGISGKQIKNRAQFTRMLSDARAGMFQMVVVKDISRFARNTVDFLNAIRSLKAQGIDVKFLSGNQTVMGDSEFILTIFGALAQEESANLSRRVKFGKNVTAARGRVPNFVFGYDKVDKYTLKINETEAAVVRQIFTLYTTAGLGVSRIAQELTAQGAVKLRRGGSWSGEAVKRILTNELYMGVIVNKKSEVSDFLSGTRAKLPEEEWIRVEREELIIVPPETFRLAGEIMRERSAAFKTARRRHSSRHLLSSLIRCSECGYAFRRLVRESGGEKSVKWVCGGRNGSGKDFCSNKTAIDEEELIAAIREYLFSMVSGRMQFVQDTLKEFHRMHRPRETHMLDERYHEKELSRITKERQRYLEMYAADVISIDELRSRTRELDRAAEAHERKLSALRDSLRRVEGVDEVIKGFLRDIEGFVSAERMTNEQLRRIVDEISVAPDGRVTVRLKLINDLGLTGAPADIMGGE